MRNSSDSSSDEECSLQPPKKRYKRVLYADYDPKNVSRNTRKRWRNKGLKEDFTTSNIIQESSKDSSDHLRDECYNVAANICTVQSSQNSSNHLSNDESSSQSSKSNTPEERSFHIQESNYCDENRNSSPPRSGSDNLHDSLNQNESDSESSSGEESCDSENEFARRVEQRCVSSDDSSTGSTEDDTDDEENDDKLSRIMFESARITVRDVVSMITAASMKYRVSDEAKVAFANIIKICAGPDQAEVSLSKYCMDKCFSSQKKHITYHFYCVSCFDKVLLSVNASKKINSQLVVCSKCNTKNTVSSNSTNYLIELNLRYQIEMLLKNEKLLVNLTSNFLRREKELDNPLNDGTIRDIHDGNLYKKMIAAEKDDEYCILSLNSSTDGAPLTKSGKRSFWPYQLVLNDLSPKLRFSNLLLSGLILTDKEPNNSLMDMYVRKVFVEPMKNLYNESIIIKHRGSTLVLKVRSGNIIADSVARPVIQQRLSFSAYYGCSWCYIRGTYTGKCVHFPHEKNVVTRTEESHNVDCKVVHYKKQNNIFDIDAKGKKKKSITCRGVKGWSCLKELDNLDLVWSFSYDKMHGLILGVVYQLWSEWRSSDSNIQIEPKKIKEIEKKFLNITPTSEIHRTPRSGIILGKAKPKAAELETWLLEYSLPCLQGVLEEEAFKHYTLLVKSGFILSKLEINPDEADECEAYLEKFVHLFEQLYGKHRLTFNVHALKHCVQSMKQCGPLSLNSAYGFESEIYKLKGYVNGPTGMDKQMCKKHFQNFLFKCDKLEEELRISQTAADYCKSLYSPKRLSKYVQSGEKVTFCGKSSLIKIAGTGYVSFKKCIFNGSVYHSILYDRTIKSDDTVVKLNSGEFARIQNILKVDNECFLQLSAIKVHPEDPFPPVDHIKKILSENEIKQNYFIRSAEEIQCKVNLVNVKTARYLSLLPNSVEIR